MARAERSPRLGADARLAPCVCGARAGAVPRDRPAQRAGAARPRAPRAHQVTDISQAGAIHEANDAPGRAASRRSTANPGASRRPAAAPHTPHRRKRTRHERDHCDST